MVPAAAVVALMASSARADDKAIAQQAFREGRELMAAGRVAEACPKFAAAAQLSPTAGVRLNLAACYGKLGRVASGWAKANEALSIAERAGDLAATKLAQEQISALEPRLSYLTVVVQRTSAAPGLEVTLDGEAIPSQVWGTALPVDPGDHEVTARAPGFQPSTTKTTITGDGTRTTVPLPTLQPIEDASAAKLTTGAAGGGPAPENARVSSESASQSGGSPPW
jgi:hypothetical protein